MKDKNIHNGCPLQQLIVVPLSLPWILRILCRGCPVSAYVVPHIAYCMHGLIKVSSNMWCAQVQSRLVTMFQDIVEVRCV